MAEINDDINALEGNIQCSGNINVSGLRMLAAGEHPLFTGVEPDDGRAFVTYNICRALPKVIGPESHGKYLGFHPQVLARCHKSLLLKQNNLNHKLKAYGAYNDKIVGCVIGTAVPANTASMGIPETVELAPSIQVCAVIFKSATGVAKMLGEHLSTKPWSVSIESRARYDQSGVYDPGDRSITGFADIQGSMKNAVKFNPTTGLELGKYKGNQLAMAMGGVEGDAYFDGVGFTRNPAETTAEITEVRATEHGEFNVAACAAPKWGVGMSVSWKPLFRAGAGEGVIQDIVYEGSVTMHSDTLDASNDDPVFKIKLPSASY